MKNDKPYWEQLWDEGLYFINENFNKRGLQPDTTDYTTKHKGIWILLTLVISFLILMVIGTILRSFIVTIITLVILVIIDGSIFRFKVFDEKMYRRLNAENELNKRFDMGGVFNNLMSITDEGQWFYKSGDRGNGVRTKFLVTFDYASKLDQSLEANPNMIKNALIPFVKQLHQHHLNFSKFNIAIQHKVSPGTLDLIRRARLLPEGSWLRLINNLQNETISSLEQNSSSTYKEYFLISGDGLRNATGLKELINSIIESTMTLSKSIVNPRICLHDEIIEFITNYYMIDSYEQGSVLQSVEKIDITKYFKFVSFIDVNGAEYSLADIMSDGKDDFITPEEIRNRARQQEEADKKAEKQKQREKERKEQMRIQKVIQQQMHNQQLQAQNAKRASKGLAPVKSNTPQGQAVSFGVTRNDLKYSKNAQKRKMATQKEKQLEARKHESEEQRKHQELTRRGVDLNDSMTLDELMRASRKDD